MKTKRAIPVHSYHREAYIAAWKLRKTKKLTGAEIARRLGLKVRTVNLWLRNEQADGAVRVRTPYAAKYQKAIKLWHEENKSAYSIAKKIGLPDSLVRYWFKKERGRNTNVERSEQKNQCRTD